MAKSAGRRLSDLFNKAVYKKMLSNRIEATGAMLRAQSSGRRAQGPGLR
jgi:hypothetical protein